MSHKEAPPLTPEQERFEKWVKERKISVGLGREKSGRYFATLANELWGAWQAGRAGIDEQWMNRVTYKQQRDAAHKLLREIAAPIEGGEPTLAGMIVLVDAWQGAARRLIGYTPASWDSPPPEPAPPCGEYEEAKDAPGTCYGCGYTRAEHGAAEPASASPTREKWEVCRRCGGKYFPSDGGCAYCRPAVQPPAAPAPEPCMFCARGEKSHGYAGKQWHTSRASSDVLPCPTPWLDRDAVQPPAAPEADPWCIDCCECHPEGQHSGPPPTTADQPSAAPNTPFHTALGVIRCAAANPDPVIPETVQLEAIEMMARTAREVIEGPASTTSARQTDDDVPDSDGHGADGRGYY